MENDATYGPEPVAADADEVRARHEANRDAWNEAADHYARAVDETVAFLRAGRSNLHPLERAMLGDLRAWCRSAVHLQCASGRDTLSLLVEGVDRVVGVDISDDHIANARRTVEALGWDAEFVRADVLDTPHRLDGTADLVYTGRGALYWLHDLDAWAAVVTRLLRPGGVVSILDDHPALALFDPDAPELRPLPHADYFATAEWSRGWPTSYIGDLEQPAERLARKHGRVWPLADVFGALTRAGLVVDHLGEHAEGYWDSLPQLSDEQRRRLPLTFTMRARRPA